MSLMIPCVNIPGQSCSRADCPGRSDPSACDFLRRLTAWRALSPEEQMAEIGGSTGLATSAPDEASVRLAMRVDLCPYASGPCGCGTGPPRLCSHPDHPAEVRRPYCLKCPVVLAG